MLSRKIFRIAKWISREVIDFWAEIAQLVKHKHQTQMDEKKQKVLSEQLDFLVDQTELYSSMLARDLAATSIIHAKQQEEDMKAKAQKAELEEISEDNTDFVDEGEKDDESTLLADEEALKKEANGETMNETQMLEKENLLSVEELKKLY